jgi:hypothetical protein
MGNDLVGGVKAIAYSPSLEVLPGGEGTVLICTFDRTAKGRGKVSVKSGTLSDAHGGAIAWSTGRGGGKRK